MEFTAVYEPEPNGSIVAYVAELPAVTVGAHNLEEARAHLAELLRRFLKRERNKALARTAATAKIEPIQVNRPTRSRPGSRNGPITPQRGRRKPRQAEPDLLAQLLELGWIDRVPSPQLLEENFQPVCLEGQPISEQIIQERR